MEVLTAMTQGSNAKAVELAKSFGWIKEDGSIKKNRERDEFEDKIANLGLKAPWS
jgi:hypothetical protein